MSQQTELPELDSAGVLRFAWRQLTSMRTALILLLMLGVGSIPGSLVPQRSQNPIQVGQYFKDSPEIARWMDRFYLFDVYGSPWFSAIYILLFISLIGCVLPRTIEHFHASRALPPATPKNLTRMEHHSAWMAQGNELELARAWFKSKRFRVLEKDGSISAEKGFARETGNLLFHLALILVLLGISFSSLFGMRGEAIINVGERFVNTPTSYDTLKYGKLYKDGDLPSFMLTADKFVAQYNLETSAPEDYTLDVSLLREGSSAIEKKVVKVNSPLTIGSTRIYLQANGYSPVVTVRDSKGNVAFQGPVPFLPQDSNLRSIGAIKVPDAKMLQVGLKTLKPGEVFEYPGGSITFEGYMQWVNLNFVADPGKKLALLGGIVAILGLLASLFTRRRRIWIRVDTQVEVAGLAKNGAPGLDLEMEQFVRMLKGDE